MCEVFVEWLNKLENTYTIGVKLGNKLDYA